MFLLFNTASYALFVQIFSLIYRFAVLDNQSKFYNYVDSNFIWIPFYFMVTLFCLYSDKCINFLQLKQKDIYTLMTFQQLINNHEIPKFDGEYLIFYDVGVYECQLFALFITVAFVFGQITQLIFAYLILKTLQSRKASFSQATYKLQRQLTIALTIQVK